MNPAASKPAILIVDDDSAFREELSKLLAERFYNDYTILQATDGSDAFHKMKNQAFEILITDMRMPRCDGRALLEKIDDLTPQHRPKHVVVVSGFKESQSELADFDNLSFISKPLDGPTMIAAIEKLRNAAKPATATSTTAPKSAAKAKIDVEFLNPFIQSTLEVLKITARVEVSRNKIYIRHPTEVSGDISALIKMSSKNYVGSMAIAFSEKCFLGIVNKMLGKEHKQLDKDLYDAAAELCNQIFGGAKVEFNRRGDELLPAIPSVVVKPGHSVKHVVDGPCIAVSFNTDAGPFIVEAVVRPFA